MRKADRHGIRRDEARKAPHEARRPAGGDHGLHVCPVCGSRLVQPTFWQQAAPKGHWRLWRRCPDCEWSCESIHGEAEIDEFDEQLDCGTRTLAAELKTLEQMNMEAMVKSFVAALEADLITADDFR